MNGTELTASELRPNPRIGVIFGGGNQKDLDKSIIKDMHEDNVSRTGQLRRVGR